MLVCHNYVFMLCRLSVNKLGLHEVSSKLSRNNWYHVILVASHITINEVGRSPIVHVL